MAESIAVLTTSQIKELAAEGFRRGYKQALADSRKAAAKDASSADHLTFAEAVQLTRYSRRSICRLVAAGRLRSIKLGEGQGGKVLFARADLEKLIAEARA